MSMPLEGATLKIATQEGKTVATWTSSLTAEEITLEPGNYVLTEVKAPTGYVRFEEEITFTVRDDGTVTGFEMSNIISAGIDGTYQIKNEQKPFDSEISVYKEFEDTNLNEMDDKERTALLSATKFELRLDENTFEVKSPEWKDGKAVVTFKSTFLSNGRTYLLSETATPEGYKIPVAHTFNVKIENGKVYYKLSTEGDESYKEDVFPTVVNEMAAKTVKISKQTMGGVELAGAEMTVTGEGVEEKWTSTTDAHELKLKPGKYTLHEETAPDGYITVTDIDFTVKDDGSIEVTKQTTTGDSEEVDNGDGTWTLVVRDEAKPVVTEPTVTEPVVTGPTAPAENVTEETRPTNGDLSKTPVHTEIVEAGAGMTAEGETTADNSASAIAAVMVLAAAAAVIRSKRRQK